MEQQDFSLNLTVDQSPETVYNAINNVRAWWSQEIEGSTDRLDGEFTYRYQDVHRCTIKVTELIPGRRVVWQVLDNHFSFTEDKSEWIGTRVIFDITQQDGHTQLQFTHQGLVPAYECYSACVGGWTQYIQHSLYSLITTGAGQPNNRETAYTVHEVALRFNQLAQQEKWFEIQDSLFADDIRSIDPPHSPYFGCAEGKAAVRRKGEAFVQRIEAVHRAHTTQPVVGGDHFAVGREMEVTLQGAGRIQLHQVMLYQVRDGRIISEQFFY